MQTIGEKIYNIRKQKGVSQEGLALELGVARQTVSKWEMDATQPTLENVESMCKFFGVNASYFFGNEELAVADAEAQSTPAKTHGEEKFKTLKTVLMVVGAVALILCHIFGIMAIHDLIAPAENEFDFYFPAMTCIIVGIILLAILITLLVLLIKKRAKIRKQKQMLALSDKLQRKSDRLQLKSKELQRKSDRLQQDIGRQTE